jgi:hypothetical protein
MVAIGATLLFIHIRNITMKVIVDEEYGYRHWVWNAPDNAKELLKAKMEDPLFFARDLPAQFPQGEWRELDYEEFRNIRESWEWDLYAFLHEHDDSSIQERAVVQYYG